MVSFQAHTMTDKSARGKKKVTAEVLVAELLEKMLSGLCCVA